MNWMMSHRKSYGIPCCFHIHRAFVISLNPTEGSDPDHNNFWPTFNHIPRSLRKRET
jgi:hypothetical protein